MNVIQLEVWQLATLIVAIITAFWALAKIIARQATNYVELRFQQLHQHMKRQDDDLRALENKLGDLRAELPRDYVRRDDHTRDIASIKVSIENLALNMEKSRREAIRWFLMVTANVSRPKSMSSEAMLPVIQGAYQDATHQEIRRELDYLEERELVKVQRDPLDNWLVELTRDGVDVVEYTVECDPGISRPVITQS